MSKSKKNVVDPDDIVDQYGADAVRWFMLSDSPPERDLEWSEAGIEGCWRFVQRLWRLTSQVSGADGADKALDRKTHQIIAGVGAEPRLQPAAILPFARFCCCHHPWCRIWLKRLGLSLARTWAAA